MAHLVLERVRCGSRDYQLEPRVGNTAEQGGGRAPRLRTQIAVRQLRGQADQVRGLLDEVDGDLQLTRQQLLLQ